MMSVDVAKSAPAGTLRCQLCGSGDLESVFSESMGGKSYTSYHCRACDLFQTLGEIASVSPDYVDLTADQLDSMHVFLQTEHKKNAFAQWMALARRYGNGGKRILDIGCGVGGFLDYAAGNGFETFGFDASAAQAENAATRHTNVRNNIDIDDYVASLGREVAFDVITMWDVFEHIRDPAKVIAGVRRHLAPGGMFFVSVPNGAPNPLKVKLAAMRGREPGLIPWEHVFYYTRNSLERVLKQNQLQVVDIGAVVPYLRPLTAHEIVRRTGFSLLSATRYAPQIFAVAKLPA
jgi:2-polyprenyl-3-methyl-5-hydroxy-6-metoxy-1,4-benzoquinol methylase